MARIEKTVFISYRRTDSAWALAVYQYLTNQNYDVFFDYTSIPSGDFEQNIVSNIKARAHFVLILTPTALDRCSNSGDWLRREIETAIDEKRNIIPLCFDGFDFGSSSVTEKLTGKLSTLNRYNGLEIPLGYFMEAMKRLCDRFLNVQLNAVLRPVSTEVGKVVKEEQVAVYKALGEREDVKELIKPSEEKPFRITYRHIWRYVIVVGILMVVLLGVFGINLLRQAPSDNTTPTNPGNTLTSTLIVKTKSVIPTGTMTVEIATPSQFIVEPSTPPQIPSSFHLIRFSQRDPRWKNDILGFGPEKIGDYGSLLTSIAMLLNGHDIDVNPQTLNEKMKEIGGFQGPSIIPSMLSTIYPNIKYLNLVISETTSAPLGQIDASLALGQPVIVQIDASPSAGVQTQYVLVYARKDADYLILDPWAYPINTSDETLLLEHYGKDLTLDKAILASMFFEYTAP